MSASITAVLLLFSLPAIAAAATRVLILSGSSSHDGRATSQHLRTLLERTGRFDVHINEDPAGTNAAMLASYDAVVLDYAELTAPLDAYVRAGNGVVIMHSGERCDVQRIYHVSIEKSKGAFTQSLADAFTTSDHIGKTRPAMADALVLATAVEDATSEHTTPLPVAWMWTDGAGRMFQSALGHNLAARQEPAVEAMVLRAIEWAATGMVKIDTPVAPAVRSLVVTGGHSYETSFYTIFDDPRMTWKHAVNNEEAFSRDIRERYDVVILYNMTDEISEAARRNLADFIEAGKGVVVLHHAVFSFRDWAWWREDVTGTQPMPKERRPPGPGYQHDVDQIIEAVATHPITEGLVPMHIVDETYATLEFSPKAQILLKTNHPTSNGPVAWIGPHGKSRVVTIQLGHDYKAHLHDGFRTLVRRAILWSAGRL